CIFVGDAISSTLFSDITLINPRGRPTITNGQKPFIEVNAQKTRLFNVSTRVALSNGTFSSYVQVDDDQAFLLDGLDTSLGGGSGKLREPPRANWASRGDLAGEFGERAGRHRNWRRRSAICEHRHHGLPLLPRRATLLLRSLQPSLCRQGAKQRNRKHHRRHARYR